MTKYCIKCGQAAATHSRIDHQFIWEPDNCQICLGRSGGMKGNENIVDGIVMCDYCHATISKYKRLLATI